MAGAIDPSRLDVLRALADPTRHALYRQLQQAAQPLTTPELAARVGLHANTVRAHLEQLCAVGLVHADRAGHGGRGRPRHRFSVAPGSPPPPAAGSRSADGAGPRSPDGAGSPPALGAIAAALVEVARRAGAQGELVREVGRRIGRERQGQAGPPAATEAALAEVVRHEADEGYDPVVVALAPGRWRVAFSACPYQALADQAPELVCALHAGAVEGMCEATQRLQVESFTPHRGAGGCHAVLRESAVADAGSGSSIPRGTKEDRRDHPHR